MHKKLITKLLATACLSLSMSPAFATDITFTSSGGVIPGTPTVFPAKVSGGDSNVFSNGDSILIPISSKAVAFNVTGSINNILGGTLSGNSISAGDFSDPTVFSRGAAGGSFSVDAATQATITGRIGIMVQLSARNGGTITVKPNNTANPGISGLVSYTTNGLNISTNSNIVIDSSDANGDISIANLSRGAIDIDGTANLSFVTANGHNIDFQGIIVGGLSANTSFKTVGTSGAGIITIRNSNGSGPLYQYVGLNPIKGQKAPRLNLGSFVANFMRHYSLIASLVF